MAYVNKEDNDETYSVIPGITVGNNHFFLSAIFHSIKSFAGGILLNVLISFPVSPVLYLFICIINTIFWNRLDSAKIVKTKDFESNPISWMDFIIS